MNPSALNRRRFIVRVTAATLAAAVSGSAFGRTHAPSARLRLAGIGIGGMGAADLSSLSSHPNVDVVALCDVDSNRLAEAGEKHPQAKRFSDFRRMFDAMADSIDAVHVSTPDHTHAPAAMTGTAGMKAPSYTGPSLGSPKMPPENPMGYMAPAGHTTEHGGVAPPWRSSDQDPSGQ